MRRRSFKKFVVGVLVASIISSTVVAAEDTNETTYTENNKVVMKPLLVGRTNEELIKCLGVTGNTASFDIGELRTAIMTQSSDTTVKANYVFISGVYTKVGGDLDDPEDIKEVDSLAVPAERFTLYNLPANCDYRFRLRFKGTWYGNTVYDYEDAEISFRTDNVNDEDTFDNGEDDSDDDTITVQALKPKRKTAAPSFFTSDSNEGSVVLNAGGYKIIYEEGLEGEDTYYYYAGDQEMINLVLTKGSSGNYTFTRESDNVAVVTVNDKGEVVATETAAPGTTGSPQATKSPVETTTPSSRRTSLGKYFPISSDSIGTIKIDEYVEDTSTPDGNDDPNNGGEDPDTPVTGPKGTATPKPAGTGSPLDNAKPTVSPDGDDGKKLNDAASPSPTPKSDSIKTVKSLSASSVSSVKGYGNKVTAKVTLPKNASKVKVSLVKSGKAVKTKTIAKTSNVSFSGKLNSTFTIKAVATASKFTSSTGYGYGIYQPVLNANKTKKSVKKNSATLHWAKVSNAKNYQVFVGTSKTNMKKVATTKASTTSYTIKKVSGKTANFSKNVYCTVKSVGLIGKKTVVSCQHTILKLKK